MEAKVPQNWKDWKDLSYSTPENLENLAERFEYFSDDVLINTYYKSGTTLTQELVYSLLYGVEAAKSKNLWLRTPFLEWAKPDSNGKIPLDWAPQLERPRVMKNHLPAAFHMRHLNAESGPRVIVVMRNPKDTMVSAYYNITSHADFASAFPSEFSDFWKVLALRSRAKDSKLGNYFDITLSWWSQKNHPRVRVYFYEDMITRKSETIRSIAEFLGVKVTEKRVQEIVQHTSFENMRNNPQADQMLVVDKNHTWLNGFNFFRKGQVGDWKNHFTVADNELMDRLILEELDPVGLKFVYE